MIYDESIDFERPSCNFFLHADVSIVSNIGNGIPDWQFFHPQSGDFVQFLAKKLDLFVI